MRRLTAQSLPLQLVFPEPYVTEVCNDVVWSVAETKISQLSSSLIVVSGNFAFICYEICRLSSHYHPRLMFATNLP